MGWFQWFSRKSSDDTTPADPAKASNIFIKLANKPGKPVCAEDSTTIGGNDSELDPRNKMFAPMQTPTKGQRSELPTARVVSSIPRDDFTPTHQPKDTQNWVYPSEQMFYNAMKRKGWTPKEEDMSNVVAIHNAVNERCWREILAWESLHSGACGNPNLSKFQGRPKDISPKARFLNAMGYKLPFDRHDWFVNRCGTEVRYIVDFYNATPLPGQPIAMHLDVRPALDTPMALFDRLYMQLKWTSSGRWLGEQQNQGPKTDTTR
mmetsp:Transcript_2369/g.4812  ORF Transcript_2369/g.4812 Transcript_2369/m.4812 type:complete len:263 (-) Transcript_2369:94-882(-)|eukprot:CAMPEP_0114239948 /NCGR_PEP_ID=MMETSP0058-20121206/8754_1 /TAXON_ID=36894 /ORGANISM="Pyramimonas parkeae, CCMP726" /LENGTH=262 /DNA_ID=CAMNT_0001352207 /DNA_START=28 /DNA_END=816 /DNA_ORIENTATION=+